MALWGGRFATSPAETVFNLSRSVDFDWRLAPYDLISSLAHLAGLERNGIVSNEQAQEIRSTLTAIFRDVVAGKALPIESDEDVHSALERLLMERLGESGGLLRAGRSRNDQVVTDLKLYLVDALDAISLDIVELAQAFLQQADLHMEVIAPGFTHLQHAQPITFAQELAKHAFALERDLDRIAQWRERAMVLPLGSGALAGSSLVPDPEMNVAPLGFLRTVENSIDGVSDRDFVVEALFVLALIGSHLSRIGEEFTLFTSSEFAWARIDDAYSTGSSIMPQKRNPDVAELARGKSGRLLGNLVTVMTVIKGLPFAYNRDLQEDKEPIFDSIDTLTILIPAVTGMVRTTKFDRERIESGSTAGFALATEIADYLVKKSIPFARAHEIAGAVVRFAEQVGKELSELTLDEFVSVDRNFGADVVQSLSAKAAVNARGSIMGTSPKSVRAANDALRARLADQRDRFQRLQAEFQRVLAL